MTTVGSIEEGAGLSVLVDCTELAFESPTTMEDERVCEAWQKEGDEDGEKLNNLHGYYCSCYCQEQLMLVLDIIDEIRQVQARAQPAYICSK